jgi:hypothetical protein
VWDGTRNRHVGGVHFGYRVADTAKRAGKVNLSHWNDDEQAKVRDLLMKYRIIFDGSELEPMKVLPHAIDTEGKKTVHQSPYRAGLYDLRQIEEEIERMLLLKVIERSCQHGLLLLSLSQKVTARPGSASITEC